MDKKALNEAFKLFFSKFFFFSLDGQYLDIANVTQSITCSKMELSSKDSNRFFSTLGSFFRKFYMSFESRLKGLQYDTSLDSFL